jgi:magnesium-transporting ATPase (P-type)
VFRYLHDNWETTVMFVMFAGQFMTSAMIYSLGGHFRQPLYLNPALCIVWIALFVGLSLAILLPDSGYTRLFHMVI